MAISRLVRQASAFAALGLLSALVCASRVAAQSAGDALTTSPDQSGFTGFASTRTPGHLGFDANLWLDYGLHPLEGKDVALLGMPIRHQLDATAIAQLGLWSRGALALRLPYTLYQDGYLSPDHHGLGNVAFDGRIRVYGEGVRGDGTVRDGTAISLRSVVHLPGKGDQPHISDRPTRLELSATVDLELFRIMTGAAFTYRTNDWNRGNGLNRFGEELRFDGGIRVPIQLLSLRYPGQVQESVLLEVGFGHFRSAPWAARYTPVEGRIGYRLAVSDFFTTLSVGGGFNQAYGNPDFRALFAFGYALRKHDQDGDGTPDRNDKCPHVPEDRDGFQDEDGCADDDNDGDQIVDEDDRCPLQAAEWGKDDDEDGCTDPEG